MFDQNPTLGPGTGTFATHTFEIFVMLLGAFLLGLWLGWLLWARYRQLAEQLQRDKDSLEASLNTQSAELGNLRTRFASLDAERTDLAAQVTNLTDDNAALRDRLLLLKTDLNDTLTHTRQLETELAISTPATDTEPETVPLEVVAEPAETPADPAPQASLDQEAAAPAAELVVTVTDDDDFLFVMQDPDVEGDSSARSAWEPPSDDDHFSDDAFLELAGGHAQERIPEGGIAGLEAEPFVLTPLQQDDLKIVEGIGPKIEELLFKAGIHTYSELAASPVPRLKEILLEAGPRFAMHDPGTWSAQALLAANGEWENLKAYQDFLNAGKRPDK